MKPWLLTCSKDTDRRTTYRIPYSEKLFKANIRSFSSCLKPLFHSEAK